MSMTPGVQRVLLEYLRYDNNDTIFQWILRSVLMLLQDHATRRGWRRLNEAFASSRPRLRVSLSFLYGTCFKYTKNV